MNGTGLGVQSLWTFFVHILHSFFPFVVGSWQVLRLLFTWEAYWPHSSPDAPFILYTQKWCLLLVALAVIVLTCWHVTHCLGLVNICWIKKGILETHLLCVCFLLSFSVFTDSVFLHSLPSLLFHIQHSHSRSSWSVPVQSGVTRKQSSYTRYHRNA